VVAVSLLPPPLPAPLCEEPGSAGRTGKVQMPQPTTFEQAQKPWCLRQSGEFPRTHLLSVSKPQPKCKLREKARAEIFHPCARSSQSHGRPATVCSPASPLHIPRSASSTTTSPFIKHNANPHRPFPFRPFCVKLTPMGSKDKGRKEVKKAPKPKPKPEPGRKREGFAPAPPK
jgi:hypothetical protein